MMHAVPRVGEALPLFVVEINTTGGVFYSMAMHGENAVRNDKEEEEMCFIE